MGYEVVERERDVVKQDRSGEKGCERMVVKEGKEGRRESESEIMGAFSVPLAVADASAWTCPPASYVSPAIASAPFIRRTLPFSLYRCSTLKGKGSAQQQVYLFSVDALHLRAPRVQFEDGRTHDQGTPELTPVPFLPRGHFSAHDGQSNT